MILKRGTLDRGVLFERNGHLDIEVFTGVDWTENQNDIRSTSQYFALIGGDVVTWRSRKKNIR